MRVVRVYAFVCLQIPHFETARLAARHKMIGGRRSVE
jgi:hypothetical protein